jgi:hypothetical protein
MLMLTDADLALAAKLGLKLVQEPETDRDRADAADPRATRMPQSWRVRDARHRPVGRLHFTSIDNLYATNSALGISAPVATIAEALHWIAPVLRHVRTGAYDGTETVTLGGKTYERPRALTACGATAHGADYSPISARVELRDGRAREMCPDCRVKLETMGARDLSNLSERSGSSTAKQRDFLRRLLDEAARNGRAYLMDARQIDQLSSREASAKIDELKARKAKGWKS